MVRLSSPSCNGVADVRAKKGLPVCNTPLRNGALSSTTLDCVARVLIRARFQFRDRYVELCVTFPIRVEFTATVGNEHAFVNSSIEKIKNFLFQDPRISVIEADVEII